MSRDDLTYPGIAPVGPAALPPPAAPGPDPLTYQLGRVNDVLNRAAYLSIFSVHDPGRPNSPIPSPRGPNRFVGIEVNEQLHRFDVRALPPRRGDGLRAANRVGEVVADLRLRWMVIPDDFVAAPGREPPPTDLDPQRSQRFTMLDGRLSFHDRSRSGFHGFGCGRTFPITVAGRPQLRIGAVVNVLEGFGRLRGLPGTLTVNGYLTPPQSLFLNVIACFLDPGGRLQARSPLRLLQAVPEPDPGTTFVVLHGEVDPDRPVTLNPTPDGRVSGSNLFEVLRLIHIGFDVGAAAGLRCARRQGPVVGRLATTTHFDPFSAASPGPLRTSDGVFTFHDPRGQEVGTLRANLAEGRVFPTPVPGLPSPLLRIGGFGPFLGGTGPFAGVEGMLSMSSVISLFPRTLSMLYVLRVIDPERRFRAAAREAWGAPA